jgi:two-component sensor histidine kinase
VEHGLAGREGTVIIEATRTEELLTVHIVDNGTGLPEGEIGDGLGTQIVKTLIQGELSGTIEWGAATNGGTDVSIEVPLRFVNIAE